MNALGLQKKIGIIIEIVDENTKIANHNMNEIDKQMKKFETTLSELKTKIKYRRCNTDQTPALALITAALIIIASCCVICVPAAIYGLHRINDTIKGIDNTKIATIEITKE